MCCYAGNQCTPTASADLPALSSAGTSHRHLRQLPAACDGLYAYHHPWNGNVHQQFCRRSVAAPMPSSVRHPPRCPPPFFARGSQLSTTHQATGCYNRELPFLHLAGRTQHETVCSSFVGWLAAVMVVVMTHLAPEGISLSQNSSRTTNSRESPRARAFHTNRPFGSHLDLDFSDSTSCREALRSDMAGRMSQLFPFGAPHGAALALFIHCLGAGRRHYCTCCAR